MLNTTTTSLQVMLLFAIIFFALVIGLAAFVEWLENESNKLNERAERTNGWRERVINFFMNF